MSTAPFRFHCALWMASFLCITALCALVSSSTMKPQTPLLSILDVRLSNGGASDVPVEPGPMHGSVGRLRSRIALRRGIQVDESTLHSELLRRQALLKRSVTIALTGSDGTEFPPLVLSLSDHPEWVVLNSGGSADFEIDTDALRSFFETNRFPGLEPPFDSVLLKRTTEGDIGRAVSLGTAKPGFRMAPEAIAEQVRLALLRGNDHVSLVAEHVNGQIINATGEDLGEFRLLAAGRSDFRGSGVGRIANVRKGFRELSNILVEPGATFSFNAAIGPVTAGRGWQKALGIFNGDQLRPITGGGICQVATTFFRASLLAGLPIVERKAHSLYVLYYEKYGVGIDATVFQGQQDLQFTNDTGHMILVQSYTDGTEAHVNLFGTPDGRSVVLEGPYFHDNTPEDLLDGQKKLSGNQIAWIRRVRHADGTEEQSTIFSSYLHPPKILSAAKFVGKGTL